MSEKNANQPLEPNKAPLQGDKKECRYCSTMMPAAASVCYHCKQNQKWWKNHFRIDHVGLFIALIMILIAYQQLQEAREERIAAKEALNKADQAEQAAAGVAKRMIDMEFETKRIFDKLKKDYDEMHMEFSNLKKDTAALKTYIDDTRTETEVLKERLKKSYEESLNLAASVKTTFEAEVIPALQVPEEVTVVYVFLQNPATLKNGSSELLGRISREDFINKFREYIKIAKSKEMKLVITASTADEKKWLQSQIKYKDNFLKEATFWEPSQNKIIEGAEVPLD